jgi:DNA primase
MAGITLKKSPRFSVAAVKSKQIIDVNSQIARFYHYILSSHPLGKPALDYLADRSIKPATIKTFQIGFSPRNSDLLVNYLRKKGFSDPDLIATGTIGRSQYGNHLYDRFSSRLVFPIYDHRDRLIAFSGRVLPGAPANQAKYINSPETDIYHKSHTVYGLNLAKDHIRSKKSVIVTEGEFDMISPFQAGIKNIVAVKGTAFTLEQLQLLRRYTDTLILALDSDFAGQSAAQKSINLADDLEFDIQVLTLGKYKDPDEAITAAPAFFKKRLKHLLPIWDFIISSAVSQHGFATVKGKKAVLAATLPFLNRISNAVIRSDYLKKLADAIGSSLDSVSQESAKKSVSSSPSKTSLPVVDDSSPEYQLQHALLSLIIGASNPQKIYADLKKDIKVFTFPVYKKILSQLKSLKSFNPKKFQDSLSSELQPVFQSVFVEATITDMEPNRRFLEINKVLAHLKTISLRQKLTDISQQISQTEKTASKKQMLKLEQRYNRYLRQLSKIQIIK